jgi:hypothetical protein
MRKPLCSATKLTIAAQLSSEQAIPAGSKDLVLLLSYVNGDEATVDVTIEFTPDRNLGWFSYSGIAASGVSTPTAGTVQLATTVDIAIPLAFTSPGFVRITFAGPGAGAGAGTLAATLAFGR